MAAATVVHGGNFFRRLVAKEQGFDTGTSVGGVSSWGCGGGGFRGQLAISQLSLGEKATWPAAEPVGTCNLITEDYIEMMGGSY